MSQKSILEKALFYVKTSYTDKSVPENNNKILKNKIDDYEKKLISQ